jgi:hypothetical protein
MLCSIRGWCGRLLTFTVKLPACQHVVLEYMLCYAGGCWIRHHLWVIAQKLFSVENILARDRVTIDRFWIDD